MQTDMKKGDTTKQPPISHHSKENIFTTGKYITDPEAFQQIVEILNFSGKGSTARHIYYALEIMRNSPYKDPGSTCLMYGQVFFVGYVLGQRAERQKRKDNYHGIETTH